MKKTCVLLFVLGVAISIQAQIYFRFGPDVGFCNSAKFDKVIAAYNLNSDVVTKFKPMNTFIGYAIDFGGSFENGNAVSSLGLGFTYHKMPLMTSIWGSPGFEKKEMIQARYIGWNFLNYTERRGKLIFNLNVLELGRFTMKYRRVNATNDSALPWGGNIVEPLSIGAYAFGGGVGIALGRFELILKVRQTTLGAFDNGLAAALRQDPNVKRRYTYSEFGLQLKYRIGGR